MLFVSHDGERMGAQLVLLHFLRWVKENTKTEISILFKAGGPLLAEFETLGEVFVWRPGIPLTTLKGRINNILRRRLAKRTLFLPFPEPLKKRQFDVVYLNTADTVPFAPMLKDIFKCLVVAHIHELSYSLQAWFPHAMDSYNMAAIDRYVAVSDSVFRNLVTKHGVLPEKIGLFNEFISVADTRKPNISANEIRKRLRAQDRFIIGAAGQGGWRKGTDIFLQVAKTVNQMIPDNNILFVWLGFLNQEIKAQVDYEIEKFDLRDKVIFTGVQESPQNYFQVFDLFLLTSREDPFPLVVLEAAALSKPVFCFMDSGGIPEIISDETGKLFGYGDINGMAEGIITASGDTGKLTLKGQRAAVLAQNFDVNVIAPRLFEYIQPK